MEKKVIIISAPSGSGKTTIVNELLKQIPGLEFSVSATTRKKRNGETHGKDYYFLNYDEFKTHIRNNAFIEYEEVYAGLLYGTLKKEIDRIWDKNNYVIFDVDVVGGINLKKYFKNNALLLFIKPHSIEELEKRLRNRGTDDEDTILVRLGKAKKELEYEPQFDKVIVNDNLAEAIEKTTNTVKAFLFNS